MYVHFALDRAAAAAIAAFLGDRPSGIAAAARGRLDRLGRKRTAAGPNSRHKIYSACRVTTGFSTFISVSALGLDCKK